MRRAATPIDGEDGLSGVDGINGIDGKDGINGKDGKSGANGLQGIDGINGADGKDGVQGTDGADGLNGQDGDIGLQGEAGPRGDKGEAGEQGPKGDKGDNGQTPDHQIDRKKGRIRFKLDNGKWGAWVEIKQEIIDRTVNSGGRGAQSLQAIKDVGRLNYNIQPIKTVAADYNAEGRDFSIVIDASLEAVTVTLPASPTKGKVYNIPCLDSTNTAKVDFNGKLFYDSSDDETLFKGENLKVQYSGTQWVSA